MVYNRHSPPPHLFARFHLHMCHMLNVSALVRVRVEDVLRIGWVIVLVQAGQDVRRAWFAILMLYIQVILVV